MDYVIGAGLVAVIIAAGSLWFAIRRYHAKQEKEAKRTASLAKRRAKQSEKAVRAGALSGLNGTSQADLAQSNFNRQADVGREMYGRGEHQ